MSTNTTQQVKMEATQPIKKVRKPKVFNPEECKTLTFEKTVVFYRKLKYEDFMKDDLCDEKGEPLTEEQRRKVWVEMCRKSVNGTVIGDEHETEAEDYELEDTETQAIEEAIDEVVNGK